MMNRLAANVVLLALVAGCAGAVARERPTPSGASRTTLTWIDIPANYGSAHEAITYLRPEFLSMRASGSATLWPTRPVAYLDGHRLADLDLLKQIPTSWIAEIRFVPGTVAAVRYRADHAGGAIMLRTHSGGWSNR